MEFYYKKCTFGAVREEGGGTRKNLLEDEAKAPPLPSSLSLLPASLS